MFKYDGEIVLGKGGGGGEVIMGIGDGSLFLEVVGGVVIEGVSGLSLFDFDGGSEVVKGVEDIRDGGVVDGLCLWDEVFKGDVCLCFLLGNLNRYWWVVGICDFCEFVLLEVDDGIFCLWVMCVSFDDNFLCLWLYGIGGNFLVWVEFDEDDEVIDVCECFFLFLRVLNSFWWFFFVMCFFFVFCVWGVLLLSYLCLIIFCL